MFQYSSLSDTDSHRFERSPRHDRQEGSEPSLWVIGGCMVGGYGLEGEAPFWHALSYSLGSTPAKTNLVQPVNLKKCLRILQSLPTQTAGSVLLLQLGHHDFAKLGRDVNARSFRKSSPTSPPAEKRDDAVPTVAGSAYIAQLCLGYAGIALDLLQDRASMGERQAEMKRAIDAILARAHRIGFERVLVLSPFPTAKARSNRHRLIGRKLLREAALQAGAEWIDVWSRFPRSGLFGSPVPRAMLHDVIHLNGAGHRLVERGLAITEARRMRARIAG